jgi:uncharacterized protein YkwD
MLKFLTVLLAMLTVTVALFAADETSPAVDARGADARNNLRNNNDITTKQPTPHSNSAAGASSGEDAAAENELLESANKSRALAGAPALRMDNSLREAARAHAQQMVASDRLEHQLPGELSLLERIALVVSSDGTQPGGTQKDQLKIDRAGENIANAVNASGANEVLMHSPPHRENLLNRDFNLAGIAAVWSKGRLYVVQDFAHEVPSYSAQQTGQLVGRAISEIRQQSGMPELDQLTPPNLDKAACSLAEESRPNAHLLATAFSNRKVITYTQSRPEVLPQGALRMLRDPEVRHFAVGACYAHNAAYPTGMYWVAILLY